MNFVSSSSASPDRIGPTLDCNASDCIGSPHSLTREAVHPTIGRRSMKAYRWTAIICLLTALVAGPVAGQEQLAPIGDTPLAVQNTNEPAVVISIGSINKLNQDINYVASAVGQPNLGMMFGMFSGMFAQGFDMDQPIGIVLMLTDEGPQPMAFLPTADIQGTLKRLEAQVGSSDTLADGTIVIMVGANTIFMQQAGPWAVLAPSKATLAMAPNDPTTLLKGLGNDYDIGLRLRLQQVPADMRNMLVGQLRAGLDQAMRQQGAEGNADAANASIEQLERLINETDELQFGINIDPSGQKIDIDTMFKAVANTELARMIQSQRPIASQFGAVVREDAAAYYHAAATVGPEAVAQTRASVEAQLSNLGAVLGNQGVSPDDITFIEKIADQVSELALKTMEEGSFDAGGMLLTGDDQFQFVAGVLVADGAEAAEIAKSAAEEVKGKPDAPEFAFETGAHAGVTLHEVRFDIPADQDEARKIFGDRATLHLGTGAKALYVAFGPDSLMQMKGLIDSAQIPTSPQNVIGQFKLKMLPILEYANSIESNDVVTSMIAAVQAANDAGLVVGTNSAQPPTGQVTNVRIHEGVLRAIGAAITNAQQQRQAQMQGQF